jgi:hypothetical protein
MTRPGEVLKAFKKKITPKSDFNGIIVVLVR